MADKNENVNTTLDENVNTTGSVMEKIVSDNSSDIVTKTGSNVVNDNISSEEKGPSAPVIQFKIPEKLSLSSPLVNLEKLTRKSDDKISEKEQIKNKISSKPKVSNLSPAEQIQQSQVTTFPYEEPSWSGLPDSGYSFEILKNGSIVETIELKDKPFFVFGRLPSCDVTMEHPSLSRHHAVIQYFKTSETSDSKPGWYLYDLDSTHGTWLNKNKVKPNLYHRIHVGHVVKFGGSSRLHILQGPEADQEEESELSITEIKQQREKQKREAEVLRQADSEQTERVRQQITADEGCSWGMGGDAEEEPEESEFLSLKPENEELYIDDPKRALNGFYEREGCDLPEYIITDGLPGKYKCRVDLPVDGENGESLSAEVMISGKKKEAVLACALEACRLLDRHQLLRQAKHESRKKKSKNWEADDFYDSDEDEFLDRTGTIEIKRHKRMIKAGKLDGKGETYNTLLEKYTSTIKEMKDIDVRLEKAKAEAAAFNGDDIDELDAYMSAIKAGVMDTKTKMQLKRQLIILRTEEMRLRRLVNIAKPASLPELKQPEKSEKPPTLPVANLKGLTGHKPTKKTLPKPTRFPVSSEAGDLEIEEEEEDESESEETNNKNNTDDNTKHIFNERNSDSDVQKNTESSEKVTKTRSTITTLSSVLEQLQNEIPHEDKQKTSNNKIKGPSAPPSENSDESLLKKMKGRKRGSMEDGGHQEKKKIKETADYDSTDPDYAVWLPPDGQSGDGKTHLNDKYGY